CRQARSQARVTSQMTRNGALWKSSAARSGLPLSPGPSPPAPGRGEGTPPPGQPIPGEGVGASGRVLLMISLSAPQDGGAPLRVVRDQGDVARLEGHVGLELEARGGSAVAPAALVIAVATLTVLASAI